MINKLFQSLSSNITSSTASSRVFPSFSQFIIEIYSKISEAILQMRFDRNNPKQFLCKTDVTSQLFQISLKKIYKTQDSILQNLKLNSKHQIFIEIFMQSKTNSNKYLIERWSLFNEGLTPNHESFILASEQLIWKSSIFMRSLLCMICTTPLWSLYSTKNSQNTDLLKKMFLDYSIFFEVKKKNSFGNLSQKPLEKEISFDSGEFRLKLKLEFLKDFSSLIESNRPKQINLEEKGMNRGRFLSEGFPYNLENNAKSDNSTNDSGVNNSGIMRWDSDNVCNKQSMYDEPRPKNYQENKNRYLLKKNFLSENVL